MASQFFLGRQPIVDIDGKIFAYELLFHNEKSKVDNNRQATSTVVSNVLNKFGTSQVLGLHKAFVKVDYDFILHDLVYNLPKDKFILSLLDLESIDEKLEERILKLYHDGYTLAINDINFNIENMKKYSRVLRYFEYIKIDTTTTELHSVTDVLRAFNIKTSKIITTKIEHEATKNSCEELGFGLFQGFYFAKPNILKNSFVDSEKLAVLKIVNMLVSEASLDDITATFETNHTLSIQLLKFINSGAFSFRNKISSINHVLTLVGRFPLAQWLMLLIYSKSVNNSTEASPLLLLVKSRTVLMQETLKLIKPNVSKTELSEAYFIGVFSLIDALLGGVIEDILDDMNISDNIKGAIVGKNSTYADILTFIIANEERDDNYIKYFIEKYELNPNEIEHVLLESIKDINTFEEALNM